MEIFANLEEITENLDRCNDIELFPDVSVGFIAKKQMRVRNEKDKASETEQKSNSRNKNHRSHSSYLETQ